MGKEPRDGSEADLMYHPVSAAKGILIVFSVCALFDFGWSYIRGRSFVGCVISVVLGLFGTAWYGFLCIPGKTKSEDPHNPAR